jgi:Erv1/Alr family protein
MPEIAIPIVEFQRLVHSRPARWWNLVSRSMVRQGNGIVVLEKESAAYVEAEQKYGAMQGDPVATTNPLSLLWTELHKRPVKCKTLVGEQAWLNHFVHRVECGSCRKHFKAMMARYPADLSSRWAYAMWTKRMHDMVNQIVDTSAPRPAPRPRPAFPLDEAIEMYGWREISVKCRNDPFADPFSHGRRNGIP